MLHSLFSLYTTVYTPQALVHFFSLVRNKKFNYIFVTQSLSTVRFFSIFPVKFTFSKMIPTVCFATTVSACFSILIQNILMHYVSSSMTTWQQNLSHSTVLHQKQPCLQLESAISPCFFPIPPAKPESTKQFRRNMEIPYFHFLLHMQCLSIESILQNIYCSLCSYGCIFVLKRGQPANRACLQAAPL